MQEASEELEEETRLRLEKIKEHKEALEKAAREKKAVVMKFGAEWCTPCKTMEDETFGDPGVKEYMDDNNVFLKVDIDQNPGLAEQYDVSKLPLTLIGEVTEDENGKYVFKPLDRVEGLVSAEEMLKKLKD